MKPNPSIPHQMSLGDVKILDWYMNGEMFDIALDQENADWLLKAGWLVYSKPDTPDSYFLRVLSYAGVDPATVSFHSEVDLKTEENVLSELMNISRRPDVRIRLDLVGSKMATRNGMVAYLAGVEIFKRETQEEATDGE